MTSIVKPLRAPVVDWRELPAAQQPSWPDPAALDAALAELRDARPLVDPRECDLLRARLAAVARGEGFLVQGGDCAESLEAANAGSLRRTASTLQQVATVFGHAMALPTVTVGRMAGQYGKPRSSSTETRDGVELPAYRGDAVNGFAFAAEARTPDPRRLVRAYHASHATRSQLRSFCASSRARVHTLDQVRRFAAASPLRDQYESAAAEIVSGHNPVELFTSHEGLLLDYEDALSRVDERSGKRYATSGHLLWIGERTRQLDGAHVEFFSGIANPIAIKVGPTATGRELAELVDRLDPRREPGRLTLITRMGASAVRTVLPGLVERARTDGWAAAWVCDPMHGNTISAPSGHKTRHLDDILDELAGFFDVVTGLGAHPGGVHLELTGDAVTECVGGGDGLGFADLPTCYRSTCDPRLNHDQSLDLAFQVAAHIRREALPTAA